MCIKTFEEYYWCVVDIVDRCEDAQVDGENLGAWFQTRASRDLPVQPSGFWMKNQRRLQMCKMKMNLLKYHIATYLTTSSP